MAFLDPLDTRIIAGVQSLKQPWFGRAMLVATFLGNGPTVAPIVLIFAGYFALHHQPALAWGFVATLPIMLFYNGLKFLFRRARPINPYAATLHSSSFPSGHAAGSMATYGLIAYVTATQLATPYGLIVGLLIGLLPLAVGTSRIYLGAHYPTDVAGGWALGLVGLAVLIRIGAF